MNRVPFLRSNKNRNAAKPDHARILAGSIFAFAASLLSFTSAPKAQAAMLIFDSDGTAVGGNLNASVIHSTVA
jgi:hypothetical protein